MTVAARNRSILVENSDGGATIIDNIPASAKITFGPVSPGNRDYRGENVLRIYTSQSNQLAVFRNVASFRDLSLSVRIREITATSQSEVISGPDGTAQSSKGETRYKFVDAEAA